MMSEHTPTKNHYFFRPTHVKFSLPVIRPSIEADLEVNPAFGLGEGRHDAGGSVLVDHDAV